MKNKSLNWFCIAWEMNTSQSVQKRVSFLFPVTDSEALKVFKKSIDT